MEEASLLEEVALQEEVALLEEAALLEEVRGPLSIDKGHTLAEGCCIWDLAYLVGLSLTIVKYSIVVNTQTA